MKRKKGGNKQIIKNEERMNEGRNRGVLARRREEIKQVRKKCRKEEEEWGEQGCNKNLKNAGREKGRINAGKKCG